MFVFLYIPVAARVMFSVDSNVSATLFHFIQLVIALLLPVFVFLFLYFIYIVFTSAATQPSYSQNQSKTRTHNLGPSNRWEEKQYAQ